MDSSSTNNGVSNEQQESPAEQLNLIGEDKFMPFGWGRFRPSYLQFLTNSKWFLAVIMVYTLCAGISMNGLPVLILPSIEKRFSLTGIELGVLAAANDIAAALFVIFIGFYGDYANKIKWVAGGAAVTGLGLLLFCLPHLMVGPYDVPDYRSGATGMCSLPNSTLSQSCKSDNAGTKWYYMMIFAIAQFIHGAGICPLYSLVPVYLDENVEMKHLPIYLALLYVSALIGPGVGTLLGGQFLSVFVDIEQPAGMNLSPKDPRWIGAWWLGTLVFGLLFFLMAIIISGFPSSLPRTEEHREKHIQNWKINKKSEKKEAKVKEILPEMKSILTNWTFLFNSLGLSVLLVFVGALIPFMGKIVQLKFGLDPVKNGYVLSGVLSLPVIGGIFFGGFAVRKFPPKSVCKRSAFYVAVTAIFTIITSFAILIPGCLNVNMAGVSTPYPDVRTISTHKPVIERYPANGLISQCNRNCSCSIGQFTPVCGSNNIVYASPCHAGCTARYDNKTFGSCSCIVTGTSKLGTARPGYCDRQCKNVAIFLLVIGLCLCTCFSATVPLKTVVLRCVPDDKRAFAMGMQYVFMKTIGLIPGPLTLGHLVDQGCRLWQDICGQKGRCFVYDVDLVSKNVSIFGAVISSIAAVCFMLSWHLYRPKDTSDATLLEKKSVEAVGASFETIF